MTKHQEAGSKNLKNKSMSNQNSNANLSKNIQNKRPVSQKSNGQFFAKDIDKNLAKMYEARKKREM